MDKEKIKARQQEILELVKNFCDEKLDQEYLEISERLVQKLGRKRTVVFATGQIKIWAAAVIHAVGTINFLFDKSSAPYVSIQEINEFFGTSKSTTGNKSKQIRNLLKLNYWDKEFSTARMRKYSPFSTILVVHRMPLLDAPEGEEEY